MDNTIIFGIDPATVTGYAIIETQPFLRTIETGTIKVNKKVCYGEGLTEYGKAIRQRFSLWKPTFVVCEDLNFSRNLRTVKALSKLLGVIEMESWRYNQCGVSYFTATEARKAIGLKGNATKEEVASHIQRIFSDDVDVNWKDTNITDALAIALAMLNNAEGSYYIGR